MLAVLPGFCRLLFPCHHSYPFEIHDDALVLKKMLEHEEMQQRVAGAAAAAAAGALNSLEGQDRGMQQATMVYKFVSMSWCLQDY
jgi:hypothetical protein